MIWQRYPGGFWFRLWRDGPGIVVLHRSNEPLFSERNGYRRFWPKWPARWRVGVVQNFKAAGK